MKLGTLWLLVGLCALAIADGVDHGHGGIVIDLAPGNAYQLLDYFEGQTRYNIQESLGSGNSEMELVYNVLNRYKKIDPKGADLFWKFAQSFESERRLISHTTFDPINDYGYIKLPNGSYVTQAIVQMQPKEPEDGRYLIDADFWNGPLKNDITTRAGLILHEIIYRDALNRGHEDSVNARYMNILISSNALVGMSQEEYKKRLHKAFFDTYLFTGVWRKYYYYPWKLGTRNEIVDFCRAINPYTDIPNEENVRSDWQAGGLENSAIARRVSEITDPQQTTVFLKGGNSAILGRDYHTENDTGKPEAALCVETIR